MPEKKQDKPRRRQFKVGDMVMHREGGGTVFQVVEVLESVETGLPSLYGCVEVRRYAGADLVPAFDEDEED